MEIRKILVFVFAAALSGCAYWDSLSRTEQGALIGGGTGAVVGSEIGDGAGGALLGGAAGAVGGGVIGNQLDRRDNDRQYRRGRYGYPNYDRYEPYDNRY